VVSVEYGAKIWT